jgi:hypothetical protein
VPPLNCVFFSCQGHPRFQCTQVGHSASYKSSSFINQSIRRAFLCETGLGKSLDVSFNRFTAVRGSSTFFNCCIRSAAMRGSGQDAQYIPPDNDLIPPPSEYVLFLNCSDVLQLGLRSSGMLLTSVSLRALWINPWVSLVRTYILLINVCPASNYHRNWYWRLSSASSVCAKDTLNFKLQSCTQVEHSASYKSSIFVNQSIMRASCAAPALATLSMVSLLFVQTLLFF